MSDDRLNADVAVYGQAVAADSGPPAITSDPLIEAGSPIEQLLRVLGLAANSGDPLDDAAGLDGYAERDAAMTEAADGFANQDTAAGTQMSQLPQMAAGVAGALAGALTGALAPLAQIPTQFAQGAGQALQAGTALMAQYRGEDSTAPDLGAPEDLSLSDEVPGIESGAADDPGPADDLAGPSGMGSAAGATSPMALWGPAPVPSASTTPASAPPLPPRTPAPPPSPAVGSAGMAGMPMIPPGPLSAGTDKAVPPETKRVSAPAVRNGAPVQGRIVSPPRPMATETIAGRPIEARRIVLPSTVDD